MTAHKMRTQCSTTTAVVAAVGAVVLFDQPEQNSRCFNIFALHLNETNSTAQSHCTRHI